MRWDDRSVLWIVRGLHQKVLTEQWRSQEFLILLTELHKIEGGGHLEGAFNADAFGVLVLGTHLKGKGN